MQTQKSEYTQQVFTCLNSIIKTLEHGVQSEKDTRTTSLT